MWEVVLSMKITFILPGLSRFPVGGYKVVYQYANFLAEKGNEVSIVHIEQVPNGHVTMRVHLKNLAIKLGFMGSKSVSWFHFDNRVKLIFNSNFSEDNIPTGDVVIATAWYLAYFVNDLTKSRGRKYYFIQHYEIQDGYKNKVDQSWRLPLKKIVIASWLQDVGRNLGVETTLVKNFVNHKEFFPTSPLERPAAISMLIHDQSWKGSSEGLTALKRISKKYPQVKILLFGVPDRPNNLPNNFEYIQNASTSQLCKQIYGQSTIFLFPSHTEGWGLTATEAMACGNALVSTDNGGVLDFGIEKRNAVIVPVGDIDAMVKGLEYLLDNPVEMRRYQVQSIKIAEDLTIVNSGNKLLSILEGD